MSHRQTRIEKAAEGSFPYWVCLIEEKCTGSNYDQHREFWRAHGLTLSAHGHSVVWQKWYCVFRFGEKEHAARFMQKFGGEPMHPKEKGKASVGRNGRKGCINRRRETPTTSAHKNVPQVRPQLAAAVIRPLPLHSLHGAG